MPFQQQLDDLGHDIARALIKLVPGLGGALSGAIAASVAWSPSRFQIAAIIACSSWPRSTGPGGNNPNRPVTGTWTFVDSDNGDASGGQVGKDWRITSKADLRTATGL